MTQSELSEHRSYLADAVRVEAYKAALTEIVRSGDVVLDLGAGTGVLGYLALEAGAASVIALERGDIIEMAQSIAADNGYADRITYVKALSSEAFLDRRVDVVVCDQIGGLVHDAGILSAFADARERFLAPGGRLVPASFRIFAAPVQYDEAREEIEFWSTSPAGVDMRAVRPMAANTEWMIHLSAGDLVPLADAHELAAFPSHADGPIHADVQFEVGTGGRLDGFLGWFRARLSPSVTLTNDPWASDHFRRWCNFYPLDKAVAAEPGDHLGFEFDVRPRSKIVSWTTTVEGMQGSQETRQSTFLTNSREDLFERTMPVPAKSLDLARRVLDEIDGTRTPQEIVDRLSGAIGTTFASRAHLENFVRRVTGVVR